MVGMSLENWIPSNNKRFNNYPLNKDSQERGISNNEATDIKPTVKMADTSGIYILLSADYDSKEEKVYLKLYDIKKDEIRILYDNTGHHPYAYSKENIDKLRMHPELLRISDRIIDLKTEKKIDPLTDKEIDVTKIIVKDPLAIGGSPHSLREKMTLWEADIKYYINYLFDRNLQIGLYYMVDENGMLKEYEYELPSEIIKMMERIKDEKFKEWLKMLSMEVPNYKRLSIDIEVLNPPGIIPQVEDPRYPIFIVSMKGSDGLKTVLVYDIRRELVRKNIENREYKIEVFDNEADLINRAIEIMRNYPIIITFNGDKFDLPYLRKRGDSIGIPDINRYIKISRNEAKVTWGIHIDIYEFFKNVSIKTYAFSNAYDIVSLDTVASALLGKGKIELKAEFQELPIEDIIDYSYRDAEITYELTEFNNNLVMNLITILARIANMTIDDVCRLSISRWIRNRIIYEHRRRNYLIPLQDELAAKGGKAHLRPITKGKKYVGAIVISPEPGIHFSVYVVDIASLYPSIIKTFNISYETVNCQHAECKTNLVPGTTTWICKKKRGIISEITGIIRDIRVDVFKKLSKNKDLPEDKRMFYDVIQNSLKVYINAIYGVTGSDIFPFYYLPAAEAVTILGRYAITKAIEKAQEMGLDVIYGDTDSLFIKGIDISKLERFIKETEEEINLKLDIDKEYRYVVFSGRKKNYFGVLKDGSIDVKGLLGKKSSTPPYIKNIFYSILDILKKVNSISDFDKAKATIEKIVLNAEDDITNGKVPIEDLAITVTLSKPLSAYTKTTPQHVKAARKLQRALKIDIQPGSVIKIIKTKDSDGVTPLELVRSYKEVDTRKYIELLRSTLSQILEAINIDIDKLKIDREYRSLDQFFTESR